MSRPLNLACDMNQHGISYTETVHLPIMFTKTIMEAVLSCNMTILLDDSRRKSSVDMEYRTQCLPTSGLPVQFTSSQPSCTAEILRRSDVTAQNR